MDIPTIMKGVFGIRLSIQSTQPSTDRRIPRELTLSAGFPIYREYAVANLLTMFICNRGHWYEQGKRRKEKEGRWWFSLETRQDWMKQRDNAWYKERREEEPIKTRLQHGTAESGFHFVVQMVRVKRLFLSWSSGSHLIERIACLIHEVHLPHCSVSH